MAPVTVEAVYDADLNKVWNALTVNDEMKKWYFDISDFQPQVGFEFEFTGENEGKVYVHKCRVTEVIPKKKLSYSWRYEGYDGKSDVTFELIPEGNKTRLKIVHEGLETFPQDIPDFKRENFIQGWKEISGKSLKKYLDE